MISCSNCGTLAPKATRFCEYCGAEFADPRLSGLDPHPIAASWPTAGERKDVRLSCQMGHEIAARASYCSHGHPVALDVMPFAYDQHGGSQQMSNFNQGGNNSGGGHPPGAGYGQPYDPYAPPQPGQQAGQPQQPNYGQPPQQPNYGQPPQQPNYGQPQQPPQQPNYGQPQPPPQQPNYGQPQQPNYGQPPPQQPNYGQPSYDPYGQPLPPPAYDPYTQPPPQQPNYGMPQGQPAPYSPPQAPMAPPAPAGMPAPAGYGAPAVAAPPAYEPPPQTALPPNALRGFLLCYQSNPTGDFWPLHGGRLTVGRANSGEQVDIPLADATISSKHAALSIDGTTGVVTLEDRGSTNGTYVNEEHIGYSGRRDLVDGDKVRFGGYNTIVKIVSRT